MSRTTINVGAIITIMTHTFNDSLGTKRPIKLILVSLDWEETSTLDDNQQFLIFNFERTLRTTINTLEQLTTSTTMVIAFWRWMIAPNGIKI